MNEFYDERQLWGSIYCHTFHIAGGGPGGSRSSDRRPGEVFYGDEVSASRSMRLPFESLFALSAGGSLVLDPRPGDPNIRERYRLWSALPACYLYVPFGFWPTSSFGISGLLSRWKRWWTRERKGIACERDELLKDARVVKTQASSGNGRVSDSDHGKTTAAKRDAYRLPHR